jgi:hypothetical protein
MAKKQPDPKPEPRTPKPAPADCPVMSADLAAQTPRRPPPMNPDDTEDGL